ncbi:alpha/beta fold hydrolase [Rhodococcus opacus]|uniref:alpha/beta fold hydrolase n=1 Tax=Rhodococcus opacus TaxID=37919 RepID=UPI0039E8495F
MITVPTMLVRGKQSDVVSGEGAKELLELIPTATLIDVTGAGHSRRRRQRHLQWGIEGFLDDDVVASRH